MGEHRERPLGGAHLFLCECGDPRCAEQLMLTPAAYESSHEPALAPGHRFPPRRGSPQERGRRAREP